MINENVVTAQYPLGEEQSAAIRSRTGVRLNDITLDAIHERRVGSQDLTIHADTLRAQAEIASSAGYEQLAMNLRRAAELVDIPNERLLAIYEALRPGRSTLTELLDLCEELEDEYGAVENARFVRQAAQAYRSQGLLRPESE